MMRIAICTPYPVNIKIAGGGAVIVRYLVDALSSQNIEVVLWLCRDYLAPVDVKMNTKTIDTPEYWEFFGLPPQMAFSLKKFAPKDFTKLREDTMELQSQNPIDAVIIFSPVTPGLWAMELAESLKIPYILTLLDYSFLCPTFTRYNYKGGFCEGVISEADCLKCSLAKVPNSKVPLFQILQNLPTAFKSWLWRKNNFLFSGIGRYHAGSLSLRHERKKDIENLFKKSAAVIYQTVIMQEQFAKAGWRHHNEHIQCYGIPLAEKAEKLVTYQDPVIKFVYLSRPTPEWGIDFLLDTWITYFSEHIDRQLTILSPNVLSLVAKRPEWQGFKNIIFSEEMIQGRVAEFHSQFHVLILPAQWQGIIALTSLEALAHGTAVIEPDLGGLSGYNLDENCGVKTYEWRNSNSLKIAIDELCVDRQQLSRLLHNACQVKTTQNWGALYTDIFSSM